MNAISNRLQIRGYISFTNYKNSIFFSSQGEARNELILNAWTNQNSLWHSMLCVKSSMNSYSKALQSASDILMYDLEDSVPNHSKQSTRDDLNTFFKSVKESKHQIHNKQLWVRLNSLNELHEVRKDLDCVCSSRISGYILPKLTSVEDISKYDELVTIQEKKNGLPIGYFSFILTYETPESILNAQALAKHSTRTKAVALGHVDLLLRTNGVYCLETLQYPRNIVLMAARAANLKAIDSADTAIKNYLLFESNCQNARTLGFDGKATLHPNQSIIAKSVFSPTRAELLWAQKILSGNNNVVNGEFVGIPVLLKASNVLNGNVKHIQRPIGSVVKVSYPVYGLDLHSVFIGQTYRSVVSVGMTEAFLTNWDYSFFNANRLTSSDHDGQRLGLKNKIIPVSLLLTLTVALSVIKFSENAIVYLGSMKTEYLQPVEVGDSFHSVMTINGFKNTSDGKTSVIETTHTLINQNNVPVFRLVKSTLFPAFDYLKARESRGQFISSRFDVTPDLTNSYRNKLISNATESTLNGLWSEIPLESHTAIVHRIIKVLGESEVYGLINQIRVTNPHHVNKYLFTASELLVPGPFVLSAAMGNTSHDLGHILHETVIYSSNINKVNVGDIICSFSYIVNRNVCPSNELLEESLIYTFGVKNIDSHVLIDLSFPSALFDDPDTMKSPGLIETIVSETHPHLYHKIVCQCLRYITRPIVKV